MFSRVQSVSIQPWEAPRQKLGDESVYRSQARGIGSSASFGWQEGLDVAVHRIAARPYRGDKEWRLYTFPR